MQRSTAKRRVASAAPIPAIVLKTGNGGDGRSRLGLALLIFMRVTAAIWIIRGLLQWSTVLMSSSDGGSLFPNLATPAMVAAVFFAVVDFIASIGLWLAAPWGGVIWLVAVGAQLLVLVVMPGFFDYPFVTGLADVGLVAGYLMLVWLAAQAGDTLV